jgi:hypothetical protein
MPREVYFFQKKPQERRIEALAYDCWEIQWLPRPKCYSSGQWLVLWNRFNRKNGKVPRGMWRRR